jgi:hypothetical protein
MKGFRSVLRRIQCVFYLKYEPRILTRPSGAGFFELVLLRQGRRSRAGTAEWETVYDEV